MHKSWWRLRRAKSCLLLCIILVLCASISRMSRDGTKNGHALTCPNREMEMLPRVLCLRWAACCAAMAMSGVLGEGAAPADSNARRSLSSSSLRKI